MSNPFTNVAHSTLDRPPPRSVAPGVDCTRWAHRRATAKASDGIAPTAVANESMSLRLAWWAAAGEMFSNFRRGAEAAGRWARGLGPGMGAPLRGRPAPHPKDL